MTTTVAGKSLREWTDAPSGEFAQAVRHTIDPKWGIPPEDLKRFKVHVRGCKTVVTDAQYDIEALSRKHAENDAREMFLKEHGRSGWDDIYENARELGDV